MRKFIRMLLLASLLPAGASAQLLERLPLPPVPSPLEVPLGDTVTDVARGATSTLRPWVNEARQLLRRHPDQLEAGPRGQPIMRAVIVALSPDPDALARALERGYTLQDDQQLEGIGQRLVTLLVPRGTSTGDALRELRRADPQGQYDFDHLYIESGSPPATPLPALAPGVPAAPLQIRVGLIDGGVDAAHPVFRRRPPALSGCGGRVLPSVHGTAVASLFVGWSEGFTGAAPGAELLAVDVYCGREAPGGRMRDVVAALSQLSAAQARVINMSIVGPDNAVLAATVRAVLARDIFIVAATGNDGPNAKPLYPAAYPGVIAVSAVDAQLRVLPEASGGKHVSFAAPGADLLAAAPDGAFHAVRGTSFAAPLVAGMLASELSLSGAAPASIVQRLAASAEDRGAKGRDSRYGYGLVGRELPARGLMAQPSR
jgi:hypothetical protein